MTPVDELSLSMLPLLAAGLPACCRFRIATTDAGLPTQPVQSSWPG
jgi:hypothetical protein